MRSFRQLLLVGAALVATLATGSANRAQAAFQLVANQTAGPQAGVSATFTAGAGAQTFGPNTIIVSTETPNHQVGDFEIATTVGASTPGAQTAVMSIQSITLTNLSDVQAQITLGLSNLFSLPGVSGDTLLLGSSLGISQPQAGSAPPNATIAFTSSVVDINAATVSTSPIQGSNAPGPNPAFINFVRGSNINLSNLATVTLAAHQTVSFTATTTVASPTPAPPAAALVISALPFVGIGGWLRRRNKLSPAASGSRS